MLLRCGFGLMNMLLAVGIFFLFASVPDRADERSPREIEIAQNLLQQLIQKSTEKKSDPAQLGKLWQQMQVRFPGTPEAQEAAWIVSKAPSVLDSLQREQISELDRPEWLPQEVVAVLGDNHGRDWGRTELTACSADGRFLASLSGQVRIWDTQVLHEIACLATSGVRTQTLAWAPKETVLATGTGNQVMLWNVARTPPRLLATLKGHTDDIRSLVFLPGGKSLVSSAPKEVIFWDLSGKHPQQQRQVAKESSEFGEEVLSPDGRFLVDNSGNQACRLWRLTADAKKEPIVLEGSWQYFAFSPDGNKLATAVFQQTRFLLWDLTGPLPRLERIVPFSNKGQNCPFFSPDGETLVRLTGPTSLELLPLTEAKHRQLGLQRGEKSREYLLSAPIWRVNFLPDGKTLVLSDHRNRCLRLLDLATGKERLARRGHRYQITSSHITLDGHILATGARDGEIRLWDLTSQRSENAVVQQSMEGHMFRHNPSVWSLAFAPNGRFLLSLQEGKPQQQTLQVWDMAKPMARQPKGVPLGKLSGEDCLFSPDGKTVAILGCNEVSRDRDVPGPTRSVPAGQLWDWKDGNLTLRQELALKDPDPRRDAVVDLGQFSPDGKLLAFLISEQQVQLWNVMGMPAREIGSISDPNEFLTAFAFSVDSSHLITANEEIVRLARREPMGLRIRLWDLRNGKPRPGKVLEDRESHYPYKMAMSPNGQFLAVADGGHVLSLWSLEMGKKLKSWQLPGSVGLRFAHDSRHLLTLNGNGSIYVWRLAQAKNRTP